MGFANPITTIDTVKNVSNKVPQLGKDLLYWPCIVGEPYPPSRMSAAQYSSYLGVTCISVPGTSATTASYSTWNALTIPPDKTYVEMTALIAMQHNATRPGYSASFTVGVNGSVGSGSLSVTCQDTYNPPASGFNATGGTNIDTSALYLFDSFLAFRKATFRISLTSIVFLLDDVPTVTLTPAQVTAFWNAVGNGRFSPYWTVQNPAGSNAATPTVYIGAVGLTWF